MQPGRRQQKRDVEQHPVSPASLRGPEPLGNKMVTTGPVREIAGWLLQAHILERHYYWLCVCKYACFVLLVDSCTWNHVHKCQTMN